MENVLDAYLDTGIIIVNNHVHIVDLIDCVTNRWEHVLVASQTGLAATVHSNVLLTVTEAVMTVLDCVLDVYPGHGVQHAMKHVVKVVSVTTVTSFLVTAPVLMSTME